VKRGGETTKVKSKMGSEVKLSEVKTFGGMCELSLIYSYVLCMWVSV
jgi:hypothetical protein